MIAHALVVRERIARTKIEHVVVRAIGPCAKCYAGEAGHADAGGSGDFNRDVDVDGAILNGRCVDEGENVVLLFRGETDSLPTEVFDRLGFSSANRDGGCVCEREGLRYKGTVSRPSQLGKTRGARDRHERETQRSYCLSKADRPGQILILHIIFVAKDWRSGEDE